MKRLRRIIMSALPLLSLVLSAATVGRLSYAGVNKAFVLAVGLTETVFGSKVKRTSLKAVVAKLFSRRRRWAKFYLLLPCCVWA
jgi:hypothetical protein